MASIPESALVGTFEMLTARLGRLEALVETMAEGQAQSNALAEAAHLAAQLAAQSGVMVETKSGVHASFVRPLVGGNGKTVERASVSWYGAPPDGEVMAFPRSGRACVSFPTEALAGLGAAYAGEVSAATHKREIVAVERRARGLLARHGLTRINACVNRHGSWIGFNMCVRSCRAGGTLKWWDEWVELALEFLGDQLEPGAWEAWVELNPDNFLVDEFFLVAACTCNQPHCHCK